MESNLNNAIYEFGGKNGVLMFLKDKNQFADIILDQIVIKQHEKLTDKQKQEINNWGFDQPLIVRTSHYSDWKGMVDVMSTIITTKDEIEKVLNEIKKDIFDESIIKYSQNENTLYNPKEVTISIAPCLKNIINFTLTEHPNQKGKILLDLWKEYNQDSIYPYTETQSFDLLNYNIIQRSILNHFIKGTNEEVKQIIELIKKIRELGVFSEKRSLQIEGGINTLSGEVNLYQVRDFAENNYADFKIGNVDNGDIKPRVFGITPENGIILPVVKGDYRYDVIEDGENNYKNGYLGAPKSITAKLGIFEQTKSMKGYIPGRSAGSNSLAHQNTRFVKEVLKRDGFAILDNYSIILGRRIKTGDKVKIISDGDNYKIETIK